MKKLLLFAMLGALFLPFSCGKTYEDGPCISFRSAKNRIIGTWKVDKFLIEDIDSTSEYNSKLGCEIEFTKEVFNVAKDAWKVKLINCNCCNPNILIGQWYFYLNNRNIIKTDYSSDSIFESSIGPFGQERNTYWTILKLTNKEFNITTYYNDFTHPLGTRKFQINLLKIKE